MIVPNTGGMKGIRSRAAAERYPEKTDRKLEVLEELTEADQKILQDYLAHTSITVSQAPGDLTFDLIVTGFRDGHEGRVRIAGAHTNVVLKELDGEVLLKKEIGGCYTQENERPRTAGPALTIEGIVDFAESVDPADVRETLERQIAYNTAISEEGLHGDYGANVGRVLLATYGGDVKVRARAGCCRRL